METNTFINKVADKISNLGLTAPAILLLEGCKPLAFLGSQLLLVTQPALDIFVATDLTKNTISLLENPDLLEALIVQLETKPAQLPHLTEET
ncbi:MAG TPA: hypothetical protein P5526_12695 [Anaerolineae bacterium]|nr:hypothetical protein [Anaerolineae bacterium]MCB0180420.1 hypothetical protein [Anaerolineae bacterium]MCB0223776.1 hypothetical protein [Anaerolineae bacterium]MCB9105328.1 hypothetical protein [Anaerolineales bacterium]HRV93013.1 hypothetical protein [Anaerolineae bacterium]